MKNTFVLFGFACGVTSSIYAEELQLDCCLTYAKENDKELFMNFKNSRVWGSEVR